MHLVENVSIRFVHFLQDFIDADRFPIDLKGRKTKVQWPGGPRYDAPTLLIEEEIRCQQTMENMSGGCISYQTGETLAVARLGSAAEIVTFLVFFLICSVYWRILYDTCRIQEHAHHENIFQPFSYEIRATFQI